MYKAELKTGKHILRNIYEMAVDKATANSCPTTFDQIKIINVSLETYKRRKPQVLGSPTVR